MAFKSDQLSVVSIVIPVRNHADIIGASIESCLAQAYPNVEIIVVDNCSTDSSAEVASLYEPRVRLVRVPRPVGSCAARNVGLSYAIGDFVLFHESDYLLFPDRLWHDLDAIAREPRADVVLSIDRWLRDGESLAYTPEPICRRERRMLRHLASVPGATERSVISMLRYGGPQRSGVLYRTPVVRAMGGYSDEVERYADRELLFRVLCRGATVAVNPRVTSAWRRDGASARRNDDHIQRLGLAKRYAAALELAGLLDSGAVQNALIAHVMGHVYNYAVQRRHHEVSEAALKLVASLRARHESGGGRSGVRKPGAARHTYRATLA